MCSKKKKQTTTYGCLATSRLRAEKKKDQNKLKDLTAKELWQLIATAPAQHASPMCAHIKNICILHKLKQH